VRAIQKIVPLSPEIALAFSAMAVVPARVSGTEPNAACGGGQRNGIAFGLPALLPFEVDSAAGNITKDSDSNEWRTIRVFILFGFQFIVGLAHN
jgi:hypothetical protein